ncbi:MAG: BlaI/MecI/CopY family transcriptional regulator [Candidatus Gastranaerophilales bacterium]|nr:BlaI/MecI/CopY family transcriptional regulator [Candidatus Gastranaerophilales bacterium]
MLSRHGSLECAILGALWGLEQNGIYTNSVKDVYDILANSQEEKRAYTTIKTVMDRLFEKKVLLRYKQGKKFYYRTVYSNQEIITKSLFEIAQRYCSGDLTRLSLILNEMMEEECLVGV